MSHERTGQPVWFIVDTTHPAYPGFIAAGNVETKRNANALHKVSATFNVDQSRALVKLVEANDSWRAAVAAGLILQVISTLAEHRAWNSSVYMDPANGWIEPEA